MRHVRARTRQRVIVVWAELGIPNFRSTRSCIHERLLKVHKAQHRIQLPETGSTNSTSTRCRKQACTHHHMSMRCHAPSSASAAGGPMRLCESAVCKYVALSGEQRRPRPQMHTNCTRTEGERSGAARPFTSRRGVAKMLSTCIFSTHHCRRTPNGAYSVTNELVHMRGKGGTSKKRAS